VERVLEGVDPRQRSLWGRHTVKLRHTLAERLDNEDVPYEPWYDEHAEVYTWSPVTCCTGHSTDRTGWGTTTF
jgi:hypothetical protein